MKNITLEKIREKRKELRITQEKMAELLGMSQSGYAKIEQGKTQLNLFKLHKIADTLQIEVSELIEPVNGNTWLNNNTAECANSGLTYHNHNYYYSSESMMAEVEKMKLIIIRHSQHPINPAN